MRKTQRFGLSILTGILLMASWPMAQFTLLICIAFVPLMILSDDIKKSRTFFGYVFISMLIWNVSTTWWMWNSTDIGAVAAIVANSLLMSLPWLGYFACKKRYSRILSLLALIVFWLGFEYIHLNWELSWPWLTLGNAFAEFPSQIQWYEYTGVGGGSLLIWIMNIQAYLLISAINEKAHYRMLLAKGLTIIGIVLIISLINRAVYIQAPAEKTGENIVVVQPNIDPYQKFELSTATEQIKKLISLSESAIDSNTRMIIWPETAMSVAAWQEEILQNSYYQPIFDFTKRHPSITLISGIETFKNYGNSKETPTAHQTENGIYYDAFNASIAIKSGEQIQLYNKSKLVPGVEALPSFLRLLAPAFEKFGGSTGGYGRSNGSMVFSSPGTKYKAAPIICYESIYGEYVASYVKKGATVLTILTNDGWWGNTPGHKQHLAYARLRAIETRRWVARSANTGVSAIINEYGEIVEQRGWDKTATIKYAVPVRSALSFYVRYGDYIFKSSLLIGLMLIAAHVFIVAKNKLTKP